MKLFFDENYSPRLVEVLGYEYPGSSHVRNEKMRGATDNTIWEFSTLEKKYGKKECRNKYDDSRPIKRQGYSENWNT